MRAHGVLSACASIFRSVRREFSGVPEDAIIHYNLRRDVSGFHK